MADIKQELANVQAQISHIETEVSAHPATPAAPDKVRLRHPFTGDTQDVDPKPEALIPLMGLGYQQVKE